MSETKSELAQLYTKVSGLTINFDKMIEDCGNDSKKKGELFSHIMWHLKRGAVLGNGQSFDNDSYAADYKKFVADVVEELGIDVNADDVDFSETVDSHDEYLKNMIERASEITIETDSSEDDGVDDGVNI